MKSSERVNKWIEWRVNERVNKRVKWRVVLNQLNQLVADLCSM